MSKYKIYMKDHSGKVGVWVREKSKDDVIQALMAYINGDGVVYMKIEYPDGSYYEYTGDE